MAEKIEKLVNNIIWFSYFAVAAATPLIFSPQNSELFEVPKMHFVYLLSTIIFISTLIKFVIKGQIQIPRSWVIATFLIFLAFQTISTFNSIDKFTSVFGYPSRLNGGLLSQFAYLVIIVGALVNFSAKFSKRLILIIILSAFVVSIWGIPSHFGKDPSCLVLNGKLSSTCWQKDFDPTLRIFSTLGQPNWLASYLVIIIPLSIAFTLNASKTQLRIFFMTISLVLFTALVMTNSRSGFLGIAIGLILFLLLLGFKKIKQNAKAFIIFIVGFLIAVGLFGGFLFARVGEAFNKSAPKTTTPFVQQPDGLNARKTIAPPTESSQIRLIVWKGALEIFKNWPLLGSGPETFAYSYYRFRPFEHNQTTEWNFFYNKAHNEFLNYLATIGILGTLAYVSLIITIAIALFKISKNELLAKAAICGFLGYLITIFFGFSTVATGTIGYLTVALVLNLGKTRYFEINLPKKIPQFIALMILAIVGTYIVSIPLRLYFADLFITRAENLGKSSPALLRYQTAITIFPFENPYYLADISLTYATLANINEDEKIANNLANKASEVASKVQRLSPNNLILERKVANSFLLIADFGEKYKQKALKSAEKLTLLAPTDPQSYLTFAKVQAALSRKDEAKKSLEKAMELKPDYPEAKELLDQIETKEIQ